VPGHDAAVDDVHGQVPGAEAERGQRLLELELRRARGRARRDGPRHRRVRLDRDDVAHALLPRHDGDRLADGQLAEIGVQDDRRRRHGDHAAVRARDARRRDGAAADRDDVRQAARLAGRIEHPVGSVRLARRVEQAVAAELSVELDHGRAELGGQRDDVRDRERLGVRPDPPQAQDVEREHRPRVGRPPVEADPVGQHALPLLRLLAHEDDEVADGEPRVAEEADRPALHLPRHRHPGSGELVPLAAQLRVGGDLERLRRAGRRARGLHPGSGGQQRIGALVHLGAHPALRGDARAGPVADEVGEPAQVGPVGGGAEVRLAGGQLGVGGDDLRHVGPELDQLRRARVALDVPAPAERLAHDQAPLDPLDQVVREAVELADTAAQHGLAGRRRHEAEALRLDRARESLLAAHRPPRT
jgi:hypothetical protein